MKNLCFLLILLSASLFLSAQTDPQLNFNGQNKVYGDNDFALGASSPVSSGSISYTIVSGEEIISINGDMARRAGNEYLAQTMIQENVETLNQYKPKKVLTGCPHCYNIIKNEYPQFGAKYEVVQYRRL